MSNGMPITVKMAMKPIPTLIKSLRSVDIMTKENKDAHKERTDSCAVPAASIIAESMMCIVLADVVLEKFGGDSMKQLLKHMKYLQNINDFYLIGMMGSGKSSVGKLLANKLQFSNIDIDKEIEKDEKLSIKEIFEKKAKIILEK